MNNSDVVKGAEDAVLLNNWVSETRKEKVKFELLWKGSRDGFGASTFHTKCDGKGATLTVVKSEHDKVFGGYTSESWGFAGSGIPQYKHDPTAFIYSLTNKTKCSTQKNTNSIWDWSGCGPCFGRGGGADIYICDNCNKIKDSYSYGNNTYQLPPGADANTYFAGSNYFIVKEIEVYSVTPQ